MKTDDSRTVETALLDVIRVETALSRFPMHRLAKQGTVPIEIRETGANGELAMRWEVSHNSKYGQPGPLAYKLDTLIVNRRVERAGRPVPGLLRLGSLNDLSRELGLAVSGKNTADIKRALLQDAGVFVSAKIRYRSADGTERELDSNFTRYEVHFVGERLPDGRKADAVYLVLGDTYRRILDAALTRPLDHAYLRTLAPIAQRWYELASYRMFAALKRHWPKVRLSYAEFCAYAPQARYMGFGLMRRQMEKVHAPHRRSGYIAGVEFEATTDHDGRPDWLVHYTPGPRAKGEYRASTQRGGGPMVIEAEPVAPEPGPAEPAGLERELVDRGVSRGVAAELVRDHPEDQIRIQLAHLDGRRRRIKDPGAWLACAVRGNFATKAVARPTKAEPPAVKAESVAVAVADQAGKQRAQTARAFWEGLTVEGRERIDAEALAQADPALRAEIEGERRPSMRRLRMSVVRDEYLKSLLNVPVVG